MKQQKYEQKTAVNERVGWAYATVFTQLVHTCANFTLTFPQWYQSLVVIPLAVNLSCVVRRDLIVRQ